MHARLPTHPPPLTVVPHPPQIQAQIEAGLGNSLTPEQKKWIKIAIIVAIVLAVLMVISLLVCIIRCICMPCCCAARLIK